MVNPRDRAGERRRRRMGITGNNPQICSLGVRHITTGTIWLGKVGNSPQTCSLGVRHITTGTIWLRKAGNSPQTCSLWVRHITTKALTEAAAVRHTIMLEIMNAHLCSWRQRVYRLKRLVNETIFFNRKIQGVYSGKNTNVWGFSWSLICLRLLPHLLVMYRSIYHKKALAVSILKHILPDVSYKVVSSWKSITTHVCNLQLCIILLKKKVIMLKKQYFDTRPTSPSTDPVMQGIWLGSQ